MLHHFKCPERSASLTERSKNIVQLKKLDKSPSKPISPVKKFTVSKIKTNTNHVPQSRKNYKGNKHSYQMDGWSILQNYIRQYNSHPQILFTVTVYSNLTYSIRAFNHFNVNIAHILITDITHLINLLNYMSSLIVCPGNSDPSFLQLAHSRKTNNFTNRHGKIKTSLLLNSLT